MVQAKDKTRRVREKSGIDLAWPNHRIPVFPWGLSVPRDSQKHAHNHSPDLHGTPSGPITNGMFVWRSFKSSINQLYGSIKIHGFTREVIFRGSSRPMCLLGGTSSPADLP